MTPKHSTTKGFAETKLIGHDAELCIIVGLTTQILFSCGLHVRRQWVSATVTPTCQSAEHCVSSFSSLSLWRILRLRCSFAKKFSIYTEGREGFLVCFLSNLLCVHFWTCQEALWSFPELCAHTITWNLVSNTTRERKKNKKVVVWSCTVSKNAFEKKRYKICPTFTGGILLSAETREKHFGFWFQWIRMEKCHVYASRDLLTTRKGFTSLLKFLCHNSLIQPRHTEGKITQHLRENFFTMSKTSISLRIAWTRQKMWSPAGRFCRRLWALSWTR